MPCLEANSDKRIADVVNPGYGTHQRVAPRILKDPSGQLSAAGRVVTGVIVVCWSRAGIVKVVMADNW